MRRWIGRAALSIASALVALLAAEGALRAMHVAPSRYVQPRHLERADKRVGLDLYPDDPRGAFPLDLRDAAARARWRARGLPAVDERYLHTPHGVPLRYSAELCRGGAIEDRGAPRVVVIGDSFTEGQGVREEDTFPARLGRAIDGAQVVNCGRRGYDFPDLYALFARHLALDPRVVVYAMLLNDPQRSRAFQARQRYLDDWILDRRRMVSEASHRTPPPWPPRLAMMIEDRLEARRVEAETTRWYQEMVGPANRGGWAATLAHLAAMDRAMRARGGALLVVLWPLLVDLRGEYPFAAAHRAIGGALEARSIAFYDALPAFRGRDPAALWVHPADHHPNERAHAIFAREVEPLVRRALEAGR